MSPLCPGYLSPLVCVASPEKKYRDELENFSLPSGISIIFPKQDTGERKTDFIVCFVSVVYFISSRFLVLC